MQAPADELLIGRIARGDRLAMQVLFARHHVRIYRFVLRLLRDEMAAEDVISEVFLDVWRQASRFEGRSAVSTWLIAIARFKALSTLRKRREEGLDEETMEAIEEPSDNPALAIEKLDKGEKLRQCLARADAGAPGSHRSGLLPREIGRRGGADHRHSGEHGKDAHVLRAQEAGRVVQNGGN